MYNRRVRVVGALGELKAAELDRQAMISMSVFVADDPAKAAQVKAERQEIKAHGGASCSRNSASKQKSAEGKATFADVSQAHLALQSAIDAVDAALAAGDAKAAAKAIVEKVDPGFDVLNASLRKASAHQYKRAEEALATAQAAYRNQPRAS